MTINYIIILLGFLSVICFCLFHILKKNKFLILTPETTSYAMNFKNAKSVLSETEWHNIAQLIFKQSNYQCDICHSKNKLECHEKWIIDEADSVQRLVGFNTLCSDCHEVKHIGLSKKEGLLKKNTLHMALTNKISVNQAKRFIKTNTTSIKDMKKDYSLDLSYLNNFSELTKRKYTKYENRSCIDIKNNW